MPDESSAEVRSEREILPGPVDGRWPNRETGCLKACLDLQYHGQARSDQERPGAYQEVETRLGRLMLPGSILGQHRARQ